LIFHALTSNLLPVLFLPPGLFASKHSLDSNHFVNEVQSELPGISNPETVAREERGVPGGRKLKNLWIRQQLESSFCASGYFPSFSFLFQALRAALQDRCTHEIFRLTF